MRFRITIPAIILGMLALLSEAGNARADAKGDRILGHYEKAFRNFKDQFGKYKMVIKHKAGNKTIKFTLYNRPGWKRLIKFTYPGDLRGQMVLVKTRKVMYVYLPAYKRVRRIAGHVRNQGFMGSDFTFDDMAIGSWSPDYSATFIKEDKKHWYIELKAKKGKNPPFPKIKMKIDKKMHQAVKIEYLSAKGRKLRTQTFINWTCQSGNKHCSPKTTRMVDHRRGNHTTDLVEQQTQWNVGIPDRYFTLRYLMKGS
jgi:outer membrane lipoprotein-sorting protein